MNIAYLASNVALPSRRSSHHRRTAYDEARRRLDGR